MHHYPHHQATIAIVLVDLIHLHFLVWVYHYHRPSPTLAHHHQQQQLSAVHPLVVMVVQQFVVPQMRQ
jgi:hypothetical protein